MKNIQNCRRGFTLLETVFALSMMSIVFGILAFVMAQVMAASSLSSTQLESTLTLHDLANQFRRDAHAATSVRIERPAEGVSRLRIEQGSGTVEYETTPGGVQRSVTVDGQLRSRDPFEATGIQVLGWNDDFAQTRELTMQLGRLADPDVHATALRHRFSIHARLGSDHQASESKCP